MSIGEDIRELRMDVYAMAVDVLDYQGYTASLRPAYSGRGMFGETTPGIVSNAPGVLVGWAINSSILMRARDTKPLTLLPLRQDSMGRETIYY